MSKLVRRRWESDLHLGPAPTGPGLLRLRSVRARPARWVGRSAWTATSPPTWPTPRRPSPRFDAEAVALADTEALARLLLRAESVASSKIEGLEVGGRRLLQAEAARALGEDAARRHRDRGARQHPRDDLGARPSRPR